VDALGRRDRAIVCPQPRRRGRAGDRLLVHAAPPELAVTVRGEDGTVVAQGLDLERAEPGPMSFLVRQGDTILLEDGWPSQDDLGRW
jgi:hypothetical protein